MGALRHVALLYSDLDEFLDCMVPFIAGGIDNHEPVFIAVGPEPLAALQAATGETARGVRWVDTNEWHPNPGARLRAFYDLVVEELEAGAKQLRLVGEPVWPDGPAEVVRERQRYESVLNDVFGRFPVRLVCTYDASRLDRPILQGALRTHPEAHIHGRDEASDSYLAPRDLLREWTFRLSDPPARASRLPRFVDLGETRRFLAEKARAAGLSDSRMNDFLVAANEVLTNALAHGERVEGVWLWADRGRLICQIEDSGPGLRDPLAGYRPPSGNPDNGRGLWLARQLVDLLEIVPAPRGTSVRFTLLL